jgi:hypothetical protein
VAEVEAEALTSRKSMVEVAAVVGEEVVVEGELVMDEEIFLGEADPMKPGVNKQHKKEPQRT